MVRANRLLFLAVAALLLLGADRANAQVMVYSPGVTYYSAPAVTYYTAPAVVAPVPRVAAYYAPSVSYYAAPAPAVTYYSAPIAAVYPAPAVGVVTTTRYGLFGYPRYRTSYYYGAGPVYWP
jgi:hypothetical protein